MVSEMETENQLKEAEYSLSAATNIIFYSTYKNNRRNNNVSEIN